MIIFQELVLEHKLPTCVIVGSLTRVPATVAAYN